ncbi:MAG: dihydropteroate synthase [Desulfatirhabdiaceae bacterium]|nr:dihydropteroate synthase [Desulfatirhabdiaceae bacterium]
MRIIADNLRVTQKAIEIAVAENNPLPLQAVVKRCQAAGADGIDINSGPLYRDPESRMTFMVEAVQQVTRLPLILDTSNPKALKAGLLACKNPATLNGLSLEPSKLEHILPLAAAHQADIVCYLLYPNGHVPPDSSERLNVAVSLYQKCLEAGVEPDRVIIDPVVAPLSWQDGLFQAREVLTVIKILPELLGFPVRTIAGLSNLTAGARDPVKRLLAEQSYLPMLAASGLSMILMNVLNAESVRVARTCRLFSQESIFTWEMVG